MLRHIVMMKLKLVEKSEIELRISKLQALLNDLPQFIPALQTMEVGINISDRSSAYDIVLVSEFLTEADLNEYRIHPKHIEVLSYIDEVVADAKVVDYFL